MTDKTLVYKIHVAESLDNRARYIAHVFDGDQVIDRISTRTMAALMYHVRNKIAEHYSTPKTNKPKPNVEAPKPKPKASKKSTATTAPVVESNKPTTETEATA